MEILGEYIVGSEAEWQELWTRSAQTKRIARDLLGPRQEVDALIRETCHFVGGAVFRSRFRLFHNGGIPLLERRCGPWTEEIIFRSPAKALDDSWVPMSLHLHLSCDDFIEVRRNYWSVLAKPSRSVAKGNIGQLEHQPCWTLWNLAKNSSLDSAAERISDCVLEKAIPWFDGFGNPAKMRRQLYEGGVPLIDPLTALEWCLYEFGSGEASDYLETALFRDEFLQDAVMRLFKRVDPNYLEGGPRVSLAQNIAALAVTYRLV